MTPAKVSALLQRGIRAARGGQRAEARELLTRVLQLEDSNEFAWLWLSGVVDSVDEQVICLQNVLAINPGNSAAEKGLRQLRSQRAAAGEPQPNLMQSVVGMEAEPRRGDAESVSGLSAAQPSPDAEATRICVHCGTVNPGWRYLCSLCSREVDGGVGPISMGSDQPLPLQLEPEPIDFVREYDTRPQGLLTLGAAWIAALTFNKRGAYEYEVFSASARRTVAGILIGGVAIPLLLSLLVGLLAAASDLDAAMSLQTTLASGAPLLMVAGIAVVALLILQFSLWVTGLYWISWLLGGKASFVVHAQLLSVAHSASILLGSAFLMLSIALATAPIGSVQGQGVPLGVAAGPLLSGLAVGVYALAIHGQALSVAHRFSWSRGIVMVALGSLLWSALISLLLMIGLIITGASLGDLQSRLSLFANP